MDGRTSPHQQEARDHADGICVCGGGGEEPPATPLRSENTLHSGAKEDVSEKREVL